MKKTLLLFLILSGTLTGQDQSENYIKTIVHKEEGNPSYLNTTPDNKVMVNVVYYDGLGRPKQEIAHRQAGTGGDLVTHIAHDGLGRQVRQYLPYVRSASLGFDGSAESNTLQFYNTAYFENTQNPYSETEFENSPLNRVLRQAAPGDLWAMNSGKEIKMGYQTNMFDEVYHFMAGPGGGLVLSNVNNGRYPAGKLYKTVAQDENSQDSYGSVTEYKNLLGQVVARRVQFDEGGYAFTYYVHDDYGNLAFVLSPKLSEQIVSGTSLVGNHQHLIDELGYRYVYDHRNRLVHKKLPGRQWEYIVYDNLNRVVAVGPVHSPFADDSSEGWLHTKYDVFNRVTYTVWSGSYQEINAEEWGLLSQQYGQGSLLSEEAIPGSNTVNGVAFNYTNHVYPNTDFHVLTVNYYDDYRFYDVDDPGVVFDQEVYYNDSQPPVGMPTGNWVRALETENDVNGSTTYMLYDKKARPIRTHTVNYLGGFTQVDMQYEVFTGKILHTVTTHQRDGQTPAVEVEEGFIYTNQDRLLANTHTVNGGNSEVIMHNDYDALGQLVTKMVGGSFDNPLQKVDFKYNIRGWLTDINNISSLAQSGAPQDLFAFKINYATVTNTVNGNVKPLYNGNIAETQWRTASDNLRRKYGYTYDHQNRLTDAWYSIPNTAVSNSYNEHLSYDLNGNILSLQRYGEEEDATLTIMIDDLVYEYDDGNKLINVTDAEHHPAGFNDGNIHAESREDDFEYDAYGNLIVDRNKGIDLIEYNHLNLPKRVSFGDMGEITYLYDANGIKLKKTVNDYQASLETDTHYLDGFQYTGDHLDFFPHAEGYVNVLDYSEFNYVYTYKDHLGNIRLRYTLNPQTDKLAILEEDHYYPFGLKHQGYNNEHEMFQIENSKVVLVPVTNPFGEEKFRYKFGGMEYQPELDLNFYDFGARNYDPALGRWMNIDPLAELMRRHSPYNFAFNNPMRFIDPDGMAPFDTTEEEEEEFDWEEFIKNLAADFINSDSEENVLTITFSDNDSNNAGDGDGGGCPEGDCDEDESLSFYGFLNNLVWALNGGALWEFQQPGYGEEPQLVGVWGVSGSFRSMAIITNNLKFNNGVLQNFTRHAFAGGRHDDLCLPVEIMGSKGFDLIRQNINFLKAGDNTLIGTINGIQKSFKAYVKDGKVMSINMYPGVSNRATTGTVINYGNVTW